ncbi:hypothetical protein RclHR1_00360044 [Rhizophagus clarus]|uniref:TLDc domain-containing protein n=1 Tax=Rhizophagus clarus TaxID=94130 RepID=A0A2Z6RB85_9GLOM|nr:hypothetical protein RclHR1_00360044 [Rhizophagus clarus]
MSGKIIVNVNREAANLDLEVTAARQEKLRKKFENESFWPLVKKGPLGSLFYGIFLYPRIFFDHFIMENSTYSISIYQETILRSIKRSMNSPLKTLRKSGRFMESLIKTFRCSEHFVPLEPEVRTEIGVKEGYWLGSITYEQKESEATILYLHGGGYIALSSLLGLRSLCYLLKQLRKQHNRHVRVLAIDYDLAPEDPFPNGLNCVERTYNWLINSGISGSKNVFLCGDSAGGGLALGLLQKLYPDDSTMKTQTLLPLGVILLSPWVELSCDSSSFTTNAKFDWISLHLCQFAAEYYIFGKEVIMFTKCYEEMINNYKNLYETKEGYDVKLYAGENNNNIKEFHVRSLILKTHSKFFKEIFSNDDIKKKDGYFIINSNNSPKINLGLQSLVTYIQEILIKDHNNFIIKNIFEILELTYRENHNKLWDFCIQEICYPNYILEFNKLLTLNPFILEIILKRNDFCIDNEIIIWENLLDWACEQLPPIQKDVDKWNKNDFILMKKRLSRFIPLIRFYHISSEDFLLKVYPFKELLSNDLINNVFTYYLSPNNINNIQLSRYSCSNIIESQHLIIISNWIDKKKYLHYNNKVDNIFHRFKLIYRSSRDGNGNTIKSFHENCDNKLNTILIAKIKNSEQIIGGYNPLTWDSSNSYKSTKDSFIFSFESKTIFQSAKVGYSNGDQPIYCGLKHGPTFGHDLDCFNNRWGSNRRFSYPKVGTVYQ